MGALTASLNWALGKADGWLSGQTRKDKRRFILEALIYLKKSKKNHLSSSSDGEDCMKVRTNMFEKARSSIIFPLLSWEECGGNNQSFQVEINIIIADWINVRSLPKRSRLSVWTTTRQRRTHGTNFVVSLKLSMKIAGALWSQANPSSSMNLCLLFAREQLLAAACRTLRMWSESLSPWGVRCRWAPWPDAIPRNSRGERCHAPGAISQRDGGGCG